MKNRIISIIIIIISLLGIIDSIYLTLTHYQIIETDVCGLSPNFNCNTLNTGEYSTIDGIINFFLGTHYYLPIPCALLSSLVFIVILFSGISIYINKSWSLGFWTVSPAVLILFSRILLIVSAMFGIFLLFVQGYLVRIWCMLCILLDSFIFINLTLMWMIRARDEHTESIQ